MASLVVTALLSALSIALCGAAIITGLLAARLRRDRDAWRLEKEHFADEIWELRAAAAARDKAEAASEAKSRFLATLSHEFRTPLNGIIGMTDLLQGTSLSSEQGAYVEAVRTSGRALADMVDEILDFSRIEAGRLELTNEDVDLVALVEGVVELLAPRAHDKGLDIAAFIEPDVPARVFGDGPRLRQVLLNLAGNAVKFTDAGGVCLRIGLAGDRITIAVADTGPGVPLARQQSIFTEFEQADNSTTRRHGGTGLGLAISKRIVERMGGQLRYDPREGGGSIFSFAIAMPVLDEGHPPANEPQSVFRRGRTAVIVSDTPFTTMFLSSVLKEAGFQVLCFSDLESAASHFLPTLAAPDLLMIDPASLTGDAQAFVARARRNGVSRVITMVTPRDRHSPDASGLDPGQEWLVKPIRKRSLLARLEAKRSGANTDERASELAHVGVGRQHVLVAEDNPINALIARRSFERIGVTVTHVADGVSALDHLRSSLRGETPRYDLVLMDVSMPGLDGLEVTRRIRALEAEGTATPLYIVALTAHAFEESHRTCRLAGMDQVLTKPVAPAQLTDLLQLPPSLRAVG